jgi:AraC-like DNA-binding protein
MATITTAAALLLALILLPLIVLAWASESRQQRARRWRRSGLTQQAIADRLGCSRSTVRRLLTA